MMSVVCVYNNWAVFNKYLLPSLESQSVEYELIAIDNSQNSYRSAAQALNIGGGRAKGKYIMFAHQDVLFLSRQLLEEVEKTLDSIPNLGIAGAAGKRDSEGILTSITNGDPTKLPGGSKGVRITEPAKVQTVDECLIIVPRSVFSQLAFDEQACSNWHLYAVDYSLSLRDFGLDAYALPLEVHHKSIGSSISSEYYHSLSKVLRKHRKNYRWVYTTMGDWRTGYPWSTYYVLSCIARLNTKDVK